MAVPITMAKVGWGTEPLTLIEWKAAEGDRVEKTSTILIITTEKIESDVDAETSGYLHIVVPEGNDAEIGSVVGYIAESEEELKTIQTENPPLEAAAAPSPEKGAPAPQASAPPSPVTTDGGRIKISPVARKMAEEHMINVSTVQGTGPGGRIVREDIEKAVAKKGSAPAPTAASINISGERRVKSVIPLRGMRAAIADNMLRSLSGSAQLTVMGEIDMTEAVKLRNTLRGQAKETGASITYTDLFVFIVARALKDHPMINSSLIDREINLWEDINIGVAVSLDDGLIVPVVHNADGNSVTEISKSIKSLAEKARQGKLVPGEVNGGTFTITNLGALGGGYRFETVIINQSESAILGTGGISDRVVARDGQVVIRPIMTYYFTYDHRVITGAVAAAFMADVTRLLENPYLLLDWTKIIL
ncbi:dihydrolipoamide acetyltransferase family protein [Chloroflexota bacterium]